MTTDEKKALIALFMLASLVGYTMHVVISLEIFLVMIATSILMFFLGFYSRGAEVKE